MLEQMSAGKQRRDEMLSLLNAPTVLCSCGLARRRRTLPAKRAYNCSVNPGPSLSRPDPARTRGFAAATSSQGAGVPRSLRSWPVPFFPTNAL